MTDSDFLADLERRAKDKKTMFLATCDEVERLQNIGRDAKVPPPRPCIKRGVILTEITAARKRMELPKKLMHLNARLHRATTNEGRQNLMDKIARVKESA